MLRDATAAISLFTRIPAWRLVKIGKEDYDRAVRFWPLAGWITSGVTALCLWCLSGVLPLTVAVVMAFAARLLLTCALHEDGLADFFDGFGGGYDKEKILAIMKDSHIGTYGTLSLIIYFLLLTAIVCSMPPFVGACAILAADPFGKACAGQLTNFLPYARPEGAKNKLRYTRMPFPAIAVMVIVGLLPSVPLLLVNLQFAWAFAAPVLMLFLLAVYMKRKIGGYTGDCCGATCLLCELSMLLGMAVIIH